MAEVEERQFVPAGERLARVETKLDAVIIRQDAMSLDLKLLMTHQTEHDALARIGKWVLWLVQGLVMAAGGAWFGRHWP